MNKLNLGCGRDIKKDYINLDIFKFPGVDIVWDLNKTPLPFGKNEFDEIFCKDILEHVEDFIFLLKDLHRILKRNGSLMIRVPHFTSKNLYADPTHRHGFSYETFKFFVKGHPNNYYFDFNFSKMKSIHLEFSKRWYLPLDYILEPFFNLNWRLIALYEQTPLRIFPANTLWIHLMK